MIRAGLEVLKTVWEHPANRNNRPFAVARAVGWQATKRLRSSPMLLRTPRGYLFHCHGDSHEAGRMIYFNGSPDPAEMDFMERLLRPGDKFLDIGANVGTYTLLAADLVGPSGQVLSVEPGPQAMERLVENCQVNGFSHVQFAQLAVADYEGEAQFTTGRDTGNHLAFATGRLSTAVKVTTLDRLIGETKFDLVKIDAEGAEALILRGADGVISRGQMPIVLMEMVQRFLVRAGSSVSSFADWLRSRGYGLFTYSVNTRTLHPWEAPVARQPGYAGDVLAISHDVLDEVTRLLAGREI